MLKTYISATNPRQGSATLAQHFRAGFPKPGFFKLNPEKPSQAGKKLKIQKSLKKYYLYPGPGPKSRILGLLNLTIFIKIATS